LPSITPDTNDYLDPRTAPVTNDTVGNRETRNFDGITLRVEHPFSFGALTSISAYRHFDTYNRESQDGTDRIYLYFDDVNIERNTSYSQEFKLSGKNDIADWVGGVSYYYDDAHQTSQLNFYTDSIDTLLQNTQGFTLYTPISQRSRPRECRFTLLGDPWSEDMINHNISKSEAVYGDVIWHLTDKLNLTTGARFTRDQREFSWYNPERTATALDASLAELQAAGIFPEFGVPIQAFQQNIVFNTAISEAAPLVASNKWTDTSPRAVLDYKFTPNVMAYVSATRGYQAGGYNFDDPGSHYEPETVWSYEAGIKSYIPDYRLLFNASVYYYKYSNLQSLTLVSDAASGLPLYEVTISDQQAKGHGTRDALAGDRCAAGQRVGGLYRRHLQGLCGLRRHQSRRPTHRRAAVVSRGWTRLHAAEYRRRRRRCQSAGRLPRQVSLQRRFRGAGELPRDPDL
jgi:iron complex outermembrane receptor protein